MTGHLASADVGSAAPDIALADADGRSAVHAACTELRSRAMALRQPNETLVNTLSRQPGRQLSVTVDSAPGSERQNYSMHSFGAVFAEVRVDRDLGEIRVPRIVSAYGAGRILNAKTARSQFMGGIVWGVGMALEEETLVDRKSGRYLNADLAEYHVPVNADIGTLDVSFVDEVDTIVNPIGVKGIGESASRASRRRSRMPCTTQRACVCVTCPSRSTR